MNNGINQVNKVIHGDCLEVLREMPDNSVDAVVTDPPYGLSKEPDIREVLTKWMNGEPYNHKHNGFMGKEWDSFVPHPDVWKEVYRVLKPGGHLLCFAGTRTQDLMTISLRLAGFQVRDVISYLFFSGFPKSLDVGKAFDRRKHGYLIMEEFKNYLNQKRLEKGLNLRQINEYLGVATNGGGVAGSIMGDKGTTSFPAKHQYEKLKVLLDLDDRYDELIEAAEREKIGERVKLESFQYKGNNVYQINGDKDKVTLDITAPATELAKKWDGWGTALKPAHEPIILCRKPIEKNVAYNVEKWGCGALNIDGCRIPTEDDLTRDCLGLASAENEGWKRPWHGTAQKKVYGSTKGRFPANCVTTDDDAFYSKYFNVTPPELCKKASKKDRLSTWDGRQIESNKHPCVKPITLMSWLIRLITPPGGVVSDPFAGSGSTLVAAKREGFRYIGIEREQEYVEIIYKRLVDERGNVNER